MSRADEIRAEIAREASATQHRRTVAGMLAGTTAIAESASRPGKKAPPVLLDPYERKELERRAPNANFHRVDDSRQARLADYQDRDPCGFCGTRRDRHAEHGCKRWRPL